MLPSVDTKHPGAVARFAGQRFAAIFPGASSSWLDTIFRDVERCFRGEHPDYLPIDLRYHDLEHTLQATVCCVALLEGRHRVGVEPRIDARQFQLAVAAVLLHDTGYLKLRHDTVGTGAKYTFCHVLRSCSFAASYLPTLGVRDVEIEAVLGAINCTGPAKEISRLHFREPVERIIGCVLGTADFLGQIAAADYPDELEILFREFEESDNFLALPPERRVFKSAEELIERTPAFWEQFVVPKLEGDFQGVYRFLAKPFPDGDNPYLVAAENNIRIIRERCQNLARKVS